MPLGASFFEDVPLVGFIYLVFTRMPGRVTVSYSGLCCCVPCLSSAIISLGVSYNKALRASPAARNSAVLMIVHPFHSTSFLVVIENNAARLVFRKAKKDPVTPVLSELHWLYKLAILGFCRLDGSLSPYLSSLLNIYQPSPSLRSSDERLLTVPRVSTTTLVKGPFSVKHL